MTSMGRGIGPVEAVWYWNCLARKAARKGDARAFYNLGEAYEYGVGVKRSRVMAVRY